VPVLAARRRAMVSANRNDYDFAVSTALPLFPQL
jgi:hypothetical protein